MNILVACEESGRVTAAFRKRGFDAFSCDLKKTTGEYPQYHFIGDIRAVLQTGFWHATQTGLLYNIKKWDCIIAFPPCTYLTVAGNRWFDVEKYGNKARARYYEREQAAALFLELALLDCPHIAIENPVGVMSSFYRKPDQIIQPYQFGHPARKATCLWLKGLPLLDPTHIVKPEIIKYKNGKGSDDPWHMDTMKLPSEERSELRSKTFPGIAEAMGAQWGEYLKGVCE